jgi:hypothetical protein
MSSRAASALPLIGIVLALANWYARPDAAWAWAAAVVMCLVMIAVRYGWQRASRRSPGNASLVRGVVEVTRGVSWGGLMMIIPLTVKLAHSYGLVDGPDSARQATRTTMIIVGAYLAVLGNAMPRQMPPLSLMQCDAARVQAFHRLTGWTWALCGLGVATAWLALPISAAGPVSISLTAAAIIITLVQLLRLRHVRVHAPGLH